MHIVMHENTHTQTQTHLQAPALSQQSCLNAGNLFQKRLITYVVPYKRSHLFSLSLSPGPIVFIFSLSLSLSGAASSSGLMIDLLKNLAQIQY